ncbi:MAG: hypothetical protein MJ084_05585 [Saccharofermentans sp.]|nr:hypothetical protein [Saccharofermentans sp.]
MGNHFYGAATNEHYEKETKNFGPIDWITVCAYFGIAAIIAGIIVENELWDALQYLILIAFTLISFSVTVICFIIKGKESSKMRKYSQSVEAVCEMVDVRKLNLFAYDDIIHNYTSPANATRYTSRASAMWSTAPSTLPNQRCTTAI